MTATTTTTTNEYRHHHHQHQRPTRRPPSSGMPHHWLAAIVAAVAVVLTIQPVAVRAAHITGTFQPQHDFFKFVVKFGFQQTERHAQSDSFGYIYGNVSSTDAFAVPLTLAVLDRKQFLTYYGNRTIYDKTVACRIMFGDIDDHAFDAQCNPLGSGDYLRRVPCAHGKLCTDEDAANVVAGSQLTYVISTLKEPSFWYVSLVACYRNKTTCRWQHYDPAVDPNVRCVANCSAAAKASGRSPQPTPTIHYDLHLVQGRPDRPGASPLTLQFSFDQQYILEMNLVFFCVYVLLVPLQLYAVRIQKHPVTKLFTLSLVLEFVSLVLILWHLVGFAAGGEGNELVRTTGDIFDIFSRTSFMLILLLLAKGWAVTRQQVSRTGWMILMAIWIPYCAFHVVLYVWNRTEVDIISDIDEYQTWPGLLVLACRTTFMLWFLYELRNTMKYEHSTKKLVFLLHFGASSLVWFIYLPVVAIIALQVSPMWRCKLLLGITNSADCLAYCVMTGLLWPNRSGQYLLLAGTNFSGMDELDELNEAPNIVRGEVNLSHDLHPDDAAVMMAPSPVSRKKRMLLDDCDDDDDDEDVVLSTDDLLRRGGHLTHVPNAMVVVGAAAARGQPTNGDLGGHRTGAAGPQMYT